MEKTEIIEILSRWNFWSREPDTGIMRERTDELLKFVRTDKIVSIVGVRRSGKTTLMKQMIKLLMGNPHDFLFVNFEEPAFEGADAALLQRIYDAYLEIVRPTGKPFIFLDEVQNVRGWERFVRSLNERKEAFITVSGSSSKLLSEELASVLTGRQIYFEVLPLSFREFLASRGFDRTEALLNATEARRLLREYMEWGGFPEVALNSDPDFRARILTSYYEDIIGRDVVQRFSVKKSDRLKALSRFYLTNTASPVSFTRISGDLKLPTETVRRFSSYLETANLIFFVRRFSWSVKEQENSPRKVYSVDVGLSNRVGYRFRENLGKIAENLVAIELKRRGKETFYWRDRSDREVDFVVKDDKVRELIQVCWDLSDGRTRQREVRSLVRAMEEFELEEGLILNSELDGEEEVDGKRIIYRPLWRWLLEK